MTSAVLLAQQPVMFHIGKEEQLPTLTIYEIIEDTKGNIWLGTEKGLLNYDGYRFQAYRNNFTKGTAVSNLQINNDGVVWCQTFYDEVLYLKNDSLYLLTAIKASDIFHQWHVDSAQYYKTYANKIVTYNQNFVSNKQYLLQSYCYGSIFWNNQLYFVDGNKVARVYKNNVEVIDNFLFNGLQTILGLSDNKSLYVIPKQFTSAKIRQVLPVKQSIDLPIDVEMINYAAQIKNEIWFCTDKGIFRFNKNFKLLENEALLPNEHVSYVFNDSRGIIWVGTLHNGIYKIYNEQSQLYLANNSISAISQIKNDLIVGDIKGKVYKIQHNKVLPLFKIDATHPVVATLSINDNEMFIAANNLYHYKNGKVITTYKVACKKIISLGDSLFAIAASGFLGLLSNKPSFNDFKNINEDTLYSKSLFKLYKFTNETEGARNKSIGYNKEKQLLYVASSKGLLAISKNTSYEILYQGKNILANQIVMMKDTLWVATQNDGLLKILNDKVLKCWNSNNSILPNSIEHVEASKQQLFISTEQQLFAFNFTQKLIIELSEQYGLNNEAINDLSVLRDSILCVATQKGLINIPIDTMQNSFVPVLYVKGVFYNGNKIVENFATLIYNQNNISIPFSAPYYFNSEDVKVLYKLNNSEWQFLDKGMRSLQLISLEPQTYNLQMKVVGLNNTESSTFSFSFIIYPPFWKSWWFYFISLLAVAATGTIIYQYQVRLLRQKNVLLKDKIQLEKNLRQSMLASIKSQMNPHFIFNALNTIQSYIYSNRKKEASDYLNKFSQLIRMVLDMSNEETITLTKELYALKLYIELEKERFDNNLHYQIQVAENIYPDHILLPTMIIQPYVENAIKHGLLHKKFDKQLTCSFSLQHHNLIVSIDDNGIGRKKAKEILQVKSNNHVSFATQANEKRLKLLQQQEKNISIQYIDKIDANGNSEGTTVTLNIAIQYKK